MREYENNGDEAPRRVARRSFRRHWPAAVLAGVALMGALVPRVPAAVALVVVDVVAVAEGYRFSKLRGQTIYNSTNEKIGERRIGRRRRGLKSMSSNLERSTLRSSSPSVLNDSRRASPPSDR